MAQMITVLIYIVSGYFLLRTLSQYFSIRKSELFVDSYPSSTLIADNCHKRIILIIAVLEEADIVIPTILHFKKCLAQRKGMKLVFVTAEKEGVPEENRTFQAIQPYASDQIILEHYPDKTGNKANQINYVVTKYKNAQKYDNELTYYGVFDADSLPDERGFDYVFCDRDSEFIYQMFGVYSSNFKNLNLL